MLSLALAFGFLYDKFLSWNWPNWCFHFLRSSCLTFIKALWPQNQIEDSRVPKLVVVDLRGFAKFYAAELARKRTILFIKTTISDVTKQQKELKNKQKHFLLLENSLFERTTLSDLDYATMRIQLKWLNKVYEYVMEQNIAFSEKFKNIKRRTVKEVAEWAGNSANLPFDFDKLNAMTEEELEATSVAYYKKTVKWTAEFSKIFQDIKAESEPLMNLSIAYLNLCIDDLQTII